MSDVDDIEAARVTYAQVQPLYKRLLEHVLELLLDCDSVEEQDEAMAGMFDAMATCAFRRSFIPMLIARMKAATANLEQLQRSSHYH